MLVRFYIETVFFPENNVDTLCWWGFILKLCFSQNTMLTPYVGEVLYWNCVFPRTQCWHLMLVRFYIETVFFPEHNVDTLCWWGFILKLCFSQNTMLTHYVGEVLYWNCVFPRRTQCWHLMLVRFYIETVFPRTQCWHLTLVRFYIDCYSWNSFFLRRTRCWAARCTRWRGRWSSCGLCCRRCATRTSGCAPTGNTSQR